MTKATHIKVNQYEYMANQDLQDTQHKMGFASRDARGAANLQPPSFGITIYLAPEEEEEVNADAWVWKTRAPKESIQRGNAFVSKDFFDLPGLHSVTKIKADAQGEGAAIVLRYDDWTSAALPVRGKDAEHPQDDVAQKQDDVMAITESDSVREAYTDIVVAALVDANAISKDAGKLCLRQVHDIDAACADKWLEQAQDQLKSLKQMTQIDAGASR